MKLHEDKDTFRNPGETDEKSCMGRFWKPDNLTEKWNEKLSITSVLF